MTRVALLLLIVLLALCQHVGADEIQLHSSCRRVSIAESSADEQPAPADGFVFEFFATTDGDILAINFVTAQAVPPFYQHTFGTPGAPPNPALVALFPSLGADSYITTPGLTSVLGGGLPADGDDTFGDVSDDGPQNDFKFAQLTIPVGAQGVFEGQFDIAGSNGVFSQNFSGFVSDFDTECIPEPDAFALAGMGLIGIVAGCRRS